MKRWMIVALLILLLVGCNNAERSETAVPNTPNTATNPGAEASPLPQPTDTAVPTPTLEPAAALVNGRVIPLAVYERELTRYEQAQAELGSELPANYHTIVLDALIERELIAQAAEQLGIVVTPEMVSEQINALREAVEGEENFNAWLTTNQWTLAEFEEALYKEMVTEQVVNAVTSDVPFTTEQVRARYIQLDDAALAQSLLDQIRGGADFAALASQYSLDQVTAPLGGDLGYFAKGALLVPEVEEAAFALAVGEVSDVVSAVSDDGQTTYYIVQVTDRDPQRPLPAEFRYTLLEQTFADWLQTQWEQAVVERFVE